MPAATRRITRSLWIACCAWSILAGSTRADGDVFAQVELPEAWERAFWSSPNAQAILKLELAAVADLVPKQAGVHFCRCPACNAPEADDPLAWSVENAKQLTCSRCRVILPNDKYPAHEEKKPAPEDTVEVLPGVVHKYPYHVVEAERALYPDERLYLSAKVDDRAREFLAKTALYAAVRSRAAVKGGAPGDPALAKLAAVIVLRFAQVYPAYATHFDQPGSLKYFEKADPVPPFRPRYQTGKWEWSGSRSVPLNLVVAYGLIRNSPAIDAAGALLGVANPRQVIERDLFLASAEFTRRQTEEYGEASLQAYRGILAVGKLLDDPTLLNDGLARLDEFSRRGFYHDGFWRQGSLTAHRRVLGQIDGWIDRLLKDEPAVTGGGGVASRLEREVPMLALARAADSVVLSERPASEVQQATWPSPAPRAVHRAAGLLGGVGVARLAVGEGENALDIELRALASFGPASQQRQTIRVAVAGEVALGDLDESPEVSSGFNRATASHNTVMIDGLNQRESMSAAHAPAQGGNFLFFAADPDFQVVTLDDPRAYPQSATRYRQTIVASAGARSRYAVAVFEVYGGLQHDQLFHAPAGAKARWHLSVPVHPWPGSLLSAGLTRVPTARADDGRWFVQAPGEITPLDRAELVRPAQAWLSGIDGVPFGARLHTLGDVPLTAITATSPDPTEGAGDRGTLVLRRRSTDGATRKSRFVTLIEPISTTGAIPPLTRVGKAAIPTAAAVVVYVETVDGPEQVLVNQSPGTTVTVKLADGRELKTDGLAVRINASGLVLAGGSFAECGGWSVHQPSGSGKLTGVTRRPEETSRGWFEVDAPIAEPDSTVGRALLIRHGDGVTHGWTIQRVENQRRSARIFVREEPGFELDPASGAARFYQFPQATYPGPHTFRISRLAR